MSDTLEAVSPKDQMLSVLTMPDNLQQLRNAALKNVRQLDVPTTRVEEWKYTRVGRIFKQKYKQHESPWTVTIDRFAIPALETQKLVFIDGEISVGLSDALNSGAIAVEALSTAASNGQLADVLATVVEPSGELFTELNTAYATDGAVVRVADNTILDKPLECLFIGAQEQIAINTRNVLEFGRSSEATVLMRFVSMDAGSTFHNSVTEIKVAENAQIDFVLLQEEDDTAFQINTIGVAQDSNSRITTTTVTLGGALVRNNLRFAVNGTNCQTNLFGLYPTRGKQHVDNHTIVDHKQPHCESNEHYKGVLDGRSTAVFNGKVFVRQDAQKTNAFQSNQNILLTDDADVNSKPELEIYADDVKCSHGSTTGQFDEEAVFYLQSRGIREDNARKLLIQAFAAEVLEHINQPALKEWLDERLTERFQ